LGKDSFWILQLRLLFYEKYSTYVRFEVFTALAMKNAVFWDVAPGRYCVNRRFGETFRFHVQGIKICEQGTSVSRWLQPWLHIPEDGR
jgi:hypothetical protein